MAQLHPSHNQSTSAQNSSKYNTLGSIPQQADLHISALPTHPVRTSERPKGVPGEYQLSTELAELVAEWEYLPQAIRAGILAMIRTVRPQSISGSEEATLPSDNIEEK